MSGIVWESIEETSSHATRRGILGNSRLSSPSHCGLSWLKEWNWRARADLHLKEEEKEVVEEEEEEEKEEETQAGTDPHQESSSTSSYAKRKPPYRKIEYIF